jgi:hypothetical protein
MCFQWCTDRRFKSATQHTAQLISFYMTVVRSRISRKRFLRFTEYAAGILKRGEGIWPPVFDPIYAATTISI